MCACGQGRKKKKGILVGLFFLFKSLLVRNTYLLKRQTWGHSPMCSLFGSRSLHTSNGGQQTTVHYQCQESFRHRRRVIALHPHVMPTPEKTPYFLRLPAEISVQQMCYASGDTANPFMTVPHIFIINSFSFHNVPCTVVRGIPRHQLQLSEVNQLQLMREKKMLSRMIPPFPSSHPVVLITVSYHSQCKQFCTTLKPIPIFLFCCVLKNPTIMLWKSTQLPLNKGQADYPKSSLPICALSIL